MDKKNLTKKFILASMNEAVISNEDKPIVGTDCLATCVGLLLYSEEEKLAIVAHVSSTPEIAIAEIFNLINKYNLGNVIFKYKIFPGFYQEHYNVNGLLEKIFNCYIPFNDSEIPDYALEKDPDTPSYRFAFDTATGKFVTDKVLYGIDYLRINENNKLRRK